MADGEGKERIIDKARSTLMELMDDKDPAIRLEAVKTALGASVLVSDGERGKDRISGRGQDLGGRSR